MSARDFYAMLLLGVATCTPAQFASAAAIVGPSLREFSEYWQEMADAVHGRWQELRSGATDAPPAGTKVAVRVALDSNGKITILEIEDEGVERSAGYLAMRAFRKSERFRPWSEEMIARLGTRKELRFVFQYADRRGKPANRVTSQGKIAMDSTASVSRRLVRTKRVVSVEFEVGSQTTVDEMIRLCGEPRRRTVIEAEGGKLEILAYPEASFTFLNDKLTWWVDYEKRSSP